MDNVKFCYGRCPSCDKTIAIPVDTNEVHCCYCGGKFLTKAAIVFYGSRRAAQITSVSLDQVNELYELKRNDTIRSDHNLPYMMSIKEVAKATGMSYDAIRRMILQGKIPAIRVGTKHMINITKFREIIDQGNEQ